MPAEIVAAITLAALATFAEMQPDVRAEFDHFGPTELFGADAFCDSAPDRDQPRPGAGRRRAPTALMTAR